MNLLLFLFNLISFCVEKRAFIRWNQLSQGNSMEGDSISGSRHGSRLSILRLTYLPNSRMLAKTGAARMTPASR
jgi:hypothetical protein